MNLNAPYLGIISRIRAISNERPFDILEIARFRINDPLIFMKSRDFVLTTLWNRPISTFAKSPDFDLRTILKSPYINFCEIAPFRFKDILNHFYRNL